MNWRQKANYLAKRVREKGALYVIWLNGAPEDNPGGLGSTTDPDELRDPGVKKLAYYVDTDGSFEADQLLADVARALGEEPQGEAEEPAGDPVVSGGDGRRDPQAGEQVTGETQTEAQPETESAGVPDYGATADEAAEALHTMGRAGAGEEENRRARSTPDSGEGAAEKARHYSGRTKPAAPERTHQTHETAMKTPDEQNDGRLPAMTLEQVAPDLHPDAERDARARLYRGWLEAYEARDSDRLDAYEYLIGCLGAAPPATSRN